MATPNMGLTLPAVGVTIGPTWATQLNVALEDIDAHDHTPGKGLPITQAAIDIADALTFNGYPAEAVGRVELVSQAATSALAATVYVVGGDLYYNNAAGTPVQITTGSSIAGASGSISGLVAPASASFDSGSASFRWNATATTRATLDAAALQLRAGGLTTANSITIAAPTAGVTSYSLTLPNAAPALVSRFLYTGTTGTSVWVQPDASTVEVSGQTLQIKDLGVVTAKIANGAVTTSKIAVGNVTGGVIGAAATGSIAYRTIVTENIAELAISTAKIADLAVATGKIADSAVTAAKIGAGAVTNTKILDGAVTTVKIADDNVTTDKLADGSVTTVKIADDDVTTAKIAAGAVTEEKIATNAVTSSKVATDAVYTAAIQNSAVTAAKIGDGQVTNAKIAAGTVNGSTGVTMDKLSPRWAGDDNTGTTSYNGSSYQDVFSVSQAFAAGLVALSLQPKDDGNDSSFYFTRGDPLDVAYVEFSVSGAESKTWVLKVPNDGTSITYMSFPMRIVFPAVGGSYTAKVRVKGSYASSAISFQNCQLYVTQGG